jgi:hypothetical protein
MPSESSSVVTNATNGIEPPRSLITTKLNKTGGIKMVVLSLNHWVNKYTLAWDIKDNSGINKGSVLKMGRQGIQLTIIIILTYMKGIKYLQKL